MSRVVLVTGASQGIGAAIAARFVELGDVVVTLSRRPVAPAGVAEALAVDVADSAAVTAAVKGLVERHGPIAVAVVNAGITRDGLVLRMTDAQWREVLSTDLDGAFYTARAVLAPMVRARHGSIIFVGSVSPFLGVPGQANYAAAKAGLVGLARSLARELASRSITVNVIAPGLIETEMTRDVATDGPVGSAAIPLGHSGQPADVAAAAVFLASDGARYITGAVLPVDGGLALGL